MSYDLPTGDEAIKSLRRELEILRESIPVNTFFIGQEQGHTGTGQLSDSGSTDTGITTYHPSHETLINTNQLQVTATTIIVDGSGNDLELQTLIGTQYNGQILTLKPKEGKTLTLKSGGNIDTSSDIEISDTEFTILQYFEDATATANEGNYLILNSSGGGGASWVGSASSILDMNNFNIEDVNALKINSDGAGSADSFTIFGTTSAGAINLVDDNDYFAIQVDGTSKLRIYYDEIQFRENITTDTANTCDIGTGSAWFGHGYMDNLTLMGSNSPALNVATGTTTLGGQVSITGRVSATGGTGKLGAEGVSEVIGLSTKCWVYGGSSTPYELGTKGTLTIPELYNNGEPSTGDLDGWFGDADGNIGLMRTFSTTRFYAKSGGIWRYETLG